MNPFSRPIWTWVFGGRIHVNFWGFSPKWWAVGYDNACRVLMVAQLGPFQVLRFRRA